MSNPRSRPPAGPGMAAVRTEGLRHAFGDVVALDGVDLVVEAGTAWLAGLLAVFVPLAVRSFRRA